MKLLITGGAGFIGSALTRYIIKSTSDSVVNVDKLTYAGNLDTVKSVSCSERYAFEQVDICAQQELSRVFKLHQPDMVIHLAAESHVDNSIHSPSDFIQTNVVGTYTLLEVVRSYYLELSEEKRSQFRFLHVSTDEVFGDLEGTNDFFTESTPYNPSSPYSASKASSDHLVRAWQRTYDLPTLITNCSNNYGPYQYPEKLIPLMITRALEGRPMPVYGSGMQIRDWLFVEDHVKALYKVLLEGEIGETYNIGGFNEWTNLDVVHLICDILESKSLVKPSGISSYRELITFVDDRLGHDHRYAIDASKINNSLLWSPSETFETGLEKTVDWFIANHNWAVKLTKGIC